MATTRTVASFTTHNVSTVPNYNKASFPANFTGQTNDSGTWKPVDSSLYDDSENPAAPMVVSKESVKTLLPASWAGRIMCFGQSWFTTGGGNGHPNMGFSDWNANDMAGICADMRSRGVDVYVLDWYAITKSSAGDDRVLDLIAGNYAATGMRFAISIDEQYLKDGGYTATTYQAGLKSAIDHFESKYFHQAGYERMTVAGVSRPLLLLWGVTGLVGSNVDWQALVNSLTANPKPLMIQYQQGGFTVAASDGAFSWLSSNMDSASNPSGNSYLTSVFFPACKSHASKICISSVCPGFNGTLTKSTAWSLGKYIDKRYGRTWLDWWKANSDFIAAGNKLDYVQIVTWDDFQEGSATQGGVRNNVKVNASLSGNIITFTTTGYDDTVRQYNLWGSMDGVNATLLATVMPSDAKQFDLTKLPFITQAGQYTLYVEAQGMPSVLNNMAPQTFVQNLSMATGTGGGITPSPPPPPIPSASSNAPVAILTSDVPGGVLPLTVNFDPSASFDLNGTIQSYRIDFGDGQTSSLPTPDIVPHIYTMQGTFLALLTVIDNNGLAGQSTVQIAVTAQDTQTSSPGLPPPPPPPPPIQQGDPTNPLKVTTPSPVPTPDPGRVLCQRFKRRWIEVPNHR